MLIQYLSDLHCEMSSQFEVFPRIAECAADLTVIAGDLAVGAAAIADLLQDMAKRLHREIIYVPGNHDFYGGSRTGRLDEFRKLASEIKEIHVLDLAVTEIQGITFIGATGWYDGTAYPVTQLGSLHDLAKIVR